MNPSPYNEHARWNPLLSKAEITLNLGGAIRIFKLNGMTDKIMMLWRTVKTFGIPLLQQYVWRTFLVNGILIGRLKNNELVIEKPDTSTMNSSEIGWYINGYVLSARKDGKRIEVCLDYKFIGEGKVGLVYKDFETMGTVKGCLVTGVVENKIIVPPPDQGFMEAEET